MRIMKLFVILFLLGNVSFIVKAKDKGFRRLQVSENNRFLQYEDGTPFFYLGDTAWELFHRLNKEEVDFYLKDRASKGFTVIQAVVLAELDGINTPNAYGHLPLEDRDPSKPLLSPGKDDDYWDHVDYVVNRANSLGLVVAMLPTWGCYWHDKGKTIFNTQNAEDYGRFLGKRYRNSDIIWVLGGDRIPENEEMKDIIRAMAKGLDAGDNGVHLCSYHPGGGYGSATYFHTEDWLDFNMRQNGHEVEYWRYSQTLDDYHLSPIKPVMDSEPVYEDHPVAFNPDKFGHTISMDCRRALYWNLFNGAFGYTYGHHSIWQMYNPKKNEPINNPLMSWQKALEQPGSSQMKYAKQLFLSRPYFTRVPADDVIVKEKVETSIPGSGRYRFLATKDSNGTYAMVYAPAGRSFSVNMEVINDEKVVAWWFNPRNGQSRKIGIYSNKGIRLFDHPSLGEMEDWILVLDAASGQYEIPEAEISQYD